MKKERILYLIIFALFFTFCADDKSKITVNEINFKSISIEETGVKNFMDSGKIKKIVKLETNDDSLIGNIDSIKIAENGDILVGDFYSSKKVLRFDKDGKYIQSYGKVGRGPGEHVSIKNFDILPDGSIIFLTDLKVIKYARSGQLLNEIRTNFIPLDIAVLDDFIYISHVGFRMSPRTDESILIFNSDLKKIGGLLEFDTRLEKYRYIPSNFFAKINQKLYFIGNYSFNLYEYDPKFSTLNCLEIPSENSTLNSIWEKKNLSESDYGEIKKRLHRFNFIYGFRDGLFLLEFCAEKRIFDYWVFNLGRRKAKVFKYAAEYFKNNLFFNKFVGSGDGCIIGVFNDNENFNTYKDNFPELKDIEFNIEDNPILAFFEFDVF